VSRHKQALIEIIESIAAEENALAQIIGAEAEQVKAFAETLHHPHHHPHIKPPSVEDLILFTTSVNRLLLTVLTKEIVLLNKFDVAAQLLTSAEEADAKEDEDNGEDNNEDNEDNEEEEEEEEEEEDDDVEDDEQIGFSR
jgi:hypothetical protein